MFRYRFYGLTAELPFECPGWVGATNAPDVVVAFGDVPETVGTPTLKRILIEANDHAFLLRVPGVGRYLVTDDGRTVIIERAGQATVADVSAFLFGPVFAAVAHQRGMLPLHASAVATPRGAALFVGPVGAGKSTLAATLAAQGFALIADDLSVITPGADGRPVVWPGVPRLGLWPDALDALGVDVETLARYRPAIEKRAFVPDQPFLSEPRPLDVIVEICPTNGAPGDPRPLKGLEKVQALRRHTYRPVLANLFTNRHAAARTLASAASTVRATVVQRQRGETERDAFPRRVAALIA